ELLLNDLVRQIYGIAVQSEVFVVGMAPGLPYEVLAPATQQAPPPPDDAADAEEPVEGSDEEGATAAPPAPTGPTLPAGFYALPVAVTVLGEYKETLDFVETLQLENPRLVLVNSVTTAV